MAKFYVQADQVNGYGGLDASGNEQYATIQEMYNSKALMVGNVLAFTLAGATNVATLGTDEFPEGLVYTDGSSSVSLNGGLALATVGTLGAFSTNVVTVAGAEANLWEVLDSGDDELLTPEGKQVYALAGTTLVDGVATEADKIQLSFVVRDDASDTWVSYEVKASSYQLVPNAVWGVGASIANDKFGDLLSGGVASKITAMEQSYEEIFKLLPNPNRSQTYVHLSELVSLVDGIVKLTIDSNNSGVFKTSADVILGGAVVNTEALAFPTEVQAGVANITENATNGFVQGVTVTVGGLELTNDAITMSNAGELTLNLSDVLGSDTLYKDTRIIVSW